MSEAPADEAELDGGVEARQARLRASYVELLGRYEALELRHEAFVAALEAERVRWYGEAQAREVEAEQRRRLALRRALEGVEAESVAYRGALAHYGGEVAGQMAQWYREETQTYVLPHRAAWVALWAWYREHLAEVVEAPYGSVTSPSSAAMRFAGRRVDYVQEEAG